MERSGSTMDNLGVECILREQCPLYFRSHFLIIIWTSGIGQAKQIGRIRVNKSGSIVLGLDLWQTYMKRRFITFIHCSILSLLNFYKLTKIICSQRVKGHLDLDHSHLFIKRHTRKDGKPTNEAAKHVIEKLKSLKSAQPPSDDSTPHQVAARNDTYNQVLVSDRPGHVSGVGTGPTPTSMWGNESKEALRTENRLLMQRMEELETTMAEKFAKMESMIRGSQANNDGKCAPSPHMDVHMTSAVEGQTVDQDVKCIIDCGDVSKMQHVADAILISIEIEKVVMGCKIGAEYCEVSITHAQRPNTSLFVKDQFRKRLSDALESHILWLKDY
ncbi:hypothetical protein Taro_022311, partial [Colocasia esculenta]|nr:hypothetical protein [Colocasia esculenta]